MLSFIKENGSFGSWQTVNISMVTQNTCAMYFFFFAEMIDGLRILQVLASLHFCSFLMLISRSVGTLLSYS